MYDPVLNGLRYLNIFECRNNLYFTILMGRNKQACVATPRENTIQNCTEPEQITMIVTVHHFPMRILEMQYI